MRTLYISYFGALKHLSHSQILPYLRQLAGAGVKVTLLSFEERQTDPAREEQARVRLKTDLEAAGIDWRWLRYHKRPSVPATLYDIAVGTGYAAYLVLTQRCQVVHARSHIPVIIGLLLKSLLGTKLVFDYRGAMAEEYVEAGVWRQGSLPYRAIKWVEDLAFRKADDLVMLTQQIKDVMRQQSAGLRANPAVVEVIPTCVDLQRFQRVDGTATRQRLGLVGKTVMVYTGSLGGWYMTEELVRLFDVGRQTLDDLHFLILTQSKHEIATALLEKAGIPPSAFTVATAAPAEVPQYLAAADFGVHFIRPGFAMKANSPTKFGEYLASGLPILTNRGIGDADRLVLEDRVGVLVDGFEPAAYRKAMTEIAALLGRGEEVRAHCRAIGAGRFSLTTVGREGYLRLYQRLGFSPG